MARNGFRILDCDLHVIEPADLWQRYTDERYRHLAPVGLDEGIPDLRINHPDGRPWGQKALDFSALRDGKGMRGRNAPYLRYAQQGWSSHSQLEAMDAEGIDVATLFPSRGLHTLAEPDMDPPLAAALARAYNDWLYDFCQADPARLIGVAMVSPFDMNDAVAEVRRCTTQLGFRGIFLRSNIVNGRTWDDAFYDPLWATLVELDVPVVQQASFTSNFRALDGQPVVAVVQGQGPGAQTNDKVLLLVFSAKIRIEEEEQAIRDSQRHEKKH